MHNINPDDFKKQRVKVVQCYQWVIVTIRINNGYMRFPMYYN